MERRGAIFHIHQRLGQQQYEGLEWELMTIIHDRTQAENLSYEALIARSAMMDFRYGIYDLEHISEIMRGQAETRFEIDPSIITESMNVDTLHLHPISSHVHIHYITHPGLEQPELFVLRFGPQAKLDIPSAASAHSLMFLIVPPKPVGLDLRLAGHLAEVVQSEHFETRWLAAETERGMNEVLMRDDHFLHGQRKRRRKRVNDVYRSHTRDIAFSDCSLFCLGSAGRINAFPDDRAGKFRKRARYIFNDGDWPQGRRRDVKDSPQC